jgi:rhodanese-related sulfurtransferase
MSTITADDLQTLLADRPAPMLDVRSHAEYETAHIPGSINVSLDELRAHTDTATAALPHGSVVICRSGARAEQARQLLTAAGRHDVRILHGGIAAWERADGPLERGRERWDLERQVRLVAGTLVVTGVLGSLVFPPALLLAGSVGGGLALAATTNTCAMGNLLARLPYNARAASATPRIADRFAHLANTGGGQA